MLKHKVGRKPRKMSRQTSFSNKAVFQIRVDVGHYTAFRPQQKNASAAECARTPCRDRSQDLGLESRQNRELENRIAIRREVPIKWSN